MSTSELDTEALIALVDFNVKQLVTMSLELQDVVSQLREQAHLTAGEEHDAT